MRSSQKLLRSRPLFRTRVYSHPLTSRSVKNPTSRRLLPRSHEKLVSATDSISPETLVSSSNAGPPPDEPEPELTTEASPLPPPPPEEPDKPKGKRSSTSSASSKELQDPQLPEGLQILWSPDAPPSGRPDSSALPPPEILDEALHNLLVTLHPQTQHRAAYPPPLTSSVEPTLALYCPIEGGDYIVDATVQELARRTGSEILVLDAVQLAAGEWGDFGPAANSLKLPRNPLHFAHASSSPSKTTSVSTSADEEDEDDDMPSPRQMMFTVLAPAGRGGGPTVLKPAKRPTPPSKVKVFFDSLVNLPSPESSSGQPKRPRLVYIRDFPTLASTSSAWYPYLLSAVSQRRKGPVTRSSSPVSNPMTIIFGMTPPLLPPPERAPPSSGSGILSMLMNRSPSPFHSSPSTPKTGKSDWSESPAAEKAREKRLQQRLKHWERGENLVMDEHHRLLEDASEGGHHSGRRPEIVVVEGGPGSGSGFPMPMPMSMSSSGSGLRDSSEESDVPLFYRTTVLVPNARSLTDERDCRVARRREINELTIRMAIGAIGGALDEARADTGLPARVEDSSAPQSNVNDVPADEAESVVAATSSSLDSSASEQDATRAQEPSALPTEPSSHERMWDDWGRQIETWFNVRRIADRAVGNVIASRAISVPQGLPTLDRTAVSWPEVHRAWAAVHDALEYRKSWLKEALPAMRKNEDEEGEEAKGKDSFDEVVERVKNDPELDQHEQRLLPTIVDSASMPTSFSQVHLPPHSIDSIRSIVSLPLLHPQAFQHGILKQHSMTGCLLFGPPGTGKTLVVRALAKEAGCRMMVISPSDVMDMYVGEGEKLVHAVFSLARKLSPCVIFLDEIDALFGARMSTRESGGAFAHRGVITEFMQEMDGLKTSRDDNVIVIGATNRPFDLDDAVLRRLPRRLLVDLPGVDERKEILKIHLRDEALDADINLSELAKQTESFSGSDLKHLCVSAALDAVKEHVKLPWVVSSQAQANDATAQAGQGQEATTPTVEQSEGASEADLTSESTSSPQRTITQRNFDKALKEITPSSSEALGAELRKWYEEYGEGRKDRKRKTIWGRDRFGFGEKGASNVEEGKVVPTVDASPEV